ncbi:pyridoxal phosphate-dependent transferase [Calycina marina]|uniref:Pyridoxal phosphate-dependent transferase n=1 Tax=Calycina marina TaxID=1763456 RepID=A0A9P8CAY6_9HELO|nr:pyridoxal phosphate-dependent transferase [Calycina marina]
MAPSKVEDGVPQVSKHTGEQEPLISVSNNGTESKKLDPIRKAATPSAPLTAWDTPGEAAFDFRSDTITTPIASMLLAIQNSTLKDDVYHEDQTTKDFEGYIAQRTSHEDALFVMSGTMGNQLALRSHLTQIPHSVLCDYRAHILTAEAGGTASLSQALVSGAVPSNGIYLTLEDIQANVVLGDEIHGCPTKVISLENTLGGTIMPLDEVRKISVFAREHGIKLHMDGARLWNAVVEGAGSLEDYCRECDSVSLCFSKGLGAPIGSMLVGKKEFIHRARWVRKAIGGGLRQMGVLTSAAKVAVDENFGTDQYGANGKLQVSHAVAKKIAKIWTDLGGSLSKPTETNMVWLDLKKAGITNPAFAALGKKHSLKVLSGRLVVHYQISDEAVDALEVLMKEIISRKDTAPKEKTVGKVYYG